VELYDNFGNRSRPSGDAPANAQGTAAQGAGSASPAGNNEQSSSSQTDTDNATSAPPPPPEIPQLPTPAEIATATSYAQQAALAAHLQQLHLNATTNRGNVPAPVGTAGQGGENNPSAPPRNGSGNLMDLMDADAPGWTFVDNERVS
jgi:hypothetical protein